MEDYANTYAEMYDDELLRLAAEPDLLTESARIVLFGELSRRGLERMKSERGSIVLWMLHRSLRMKEKK